MGSCAARLRRLSSGLLCRPKSVIPSAIRDVLSRADHARAGGDRSGRSACFAYFRVGAGQSALAVNQRGYMMAGWSVPQYLHFVAAGGRSSDKHAGHVLTGAGEPNTVTPRFAEIALYGITMAKYNTDMNTMK
jgi:hypothetical protein